MSTASRCGGTTRTGRACRAWAVRGSNPPRCPAHRELDGTPREFPGRDLPATINHSPGPPPEWTGIASAEPTVSALDDEIRLVRAILSRLLAELQATPDLRVEQLAEFAPLVFAGTRTVSHLLRDQRALSGDAAAGIAGAISLALDELSTEWGVRL